MSNDHQDILTWWRHQMEPFSRYWPFVWGIHRSPVNSPHKGQWRGALMFSLICVWIKGWVNNREPGDLRCYRAHYDFTVMIHLSAFLLFVQQFVLANIKGNIKSPHHWPFVFHQWQMDSPHKGPVMQKAFTFHNIIMHCHCYELWPRGFCM